MEYTPEQIDELVAIKIREKGRAYYQQYKENNPEKFLQYKQRKNTKYYEKHKEELKQKRLEKKALAKIDLESV